MTDIVLYFCSVMNILNSFDVFKFRFKFYKFYQKKPEDLYKITFSWNVYQIYDNVFFDQLVMNISIHIGTYYTTIKDSLYRYSTYDYISEIKFYAYINKYKLFTQVLGGQKVDSAEHE